MVNISRKWGTVFQMCCLLLLLGLVSCDNDNEPKNEPKYKTHADIKFIFEVSPTFEDEFNEKVKSVALYVFDENDNFVKVFEESGEKLSKDGYTLSVDGLAPGNYSCIAWCGLKDKNDKKSYFSLSDMKEGTSTREDLICRMATNVSDGENRSDADLNALFYGSIDEMTIAEEGTVTTPTYSVNLIQDTKELTITISNISDNKSLNASDYIIIYEDNNSILGWNNTPVENSTVVYSPYSVEEVQLEGSTHKSIVAKLKVNRLMAESRGWLRIYDNNNTEKDLIRIPLVPYLLMSFTPLTFPEGEILSDQAKLDKVNSYTVPFVIDD